MLDKVRMFLDKDPNSYIYKEKWSDVLIDLFAGKKWFYSNAPESIKASVAIVNMNDIKSEKVKAITLRSNHHQNPMHNATRVIEKCRSLWNVIF